MKCIDCNEYHGDEAMGVCEAMEHIIASPKVEKVCLYKLFEGKHIREKDDRDVRNLEEE